MKLNLPENFEGSMDLDLLESFFFQVERYFALVGLTDENKAANFVSMLLTKHAAVWLRSQAYDWSTATCTENKNAMSAYFRPADHERKARDELYRCVQ